ENAESSTGQVSGDAFTGIGNHTNERAVGVDGVHLRNIVRRNAGVIDSEVVAGTVQVFQTDTDLDAIGDFRDDLDDVTAKIGGVGIDANALAIDGIGGEQAEEVERLVVAEIGDRALLTGHDGG